MNQSDTRFCLIQARPRDGGRVNWLATFIIGDCCLTTGRIDVMQDELELAMVEDRRSDGVPAGRRFVAIRPMDPL